MTEAERPSRALRSVGAIAHAYSVVFASGPAAPVLSRPKPIRHTGFDLDLVVAEKRVEADGVVSLKLVDPDGQQLPQWAPGAHLDVFLESGLQRQYSLNGDPADRSAYRIAVRRIEDGGGGSREVHDALPEGQRLSIRGPRNAFRFVKADSYLFVAGGIGITPILPMVRAAAAGNVPWKLVYVGRSRATMPFLAELEALAGDRLTVLTDDEHGLPDPAALLSQASAGAAVYVCGPPPLLDAAKTLMPELNPTASLHTERFSPAPVLGGEPFEVVLRRSGTTVSVAADETTLAAIRREIPSVRYSCQQGFCGSCKVSVLKGEVAHRDTKLQPSERESSMLICVSRAAGDTVVVDL